MLEGCTAELQLPKAAPVLMEPPGAANHLKERRRKRALDACWEPVPHGEPWVTGPERHSLWDAAVGGKQSRQEECRQGWLEGQGGSWRVAEGRRGEERLEVGEEGGEGDEVRDDVGDVI